MNNAQHEIAIVEIKTSQQELDTTVHTGHADAQAKATHANENDI